MTKQGNVQFFALVSDRSNNNSTPRVISHRFKSRRQKIAADSARLSQFGLRLTAELSMVFVEEWKNSPDARVNIGSRACLTPVLSHGNSCECLFMEKCDFLRLLNPKELDDHGMSCINSTP